MADDRLHKINNGISARPRDIMVDMCQFDLSGTIRVGFVRTNSVASRTNLVMWVPRTAEFKNLRQRQPDLPCA